MTRHVLGSLTADGRTSGVRWYGKHEGYGSFGCTGNLGGGTVSLDISFDGGSNWSPIPDSSLTATGVKGFQLQSDPQNPPLLSASIAGSTAPSVTFFILDEDR